MSFDRLAKSYLTLERLSFGDRLQTCRVAGLSWILPPNEVLLLGEGNGRFLTELVQAFPEARVHVVDASSAMLAQARKRVGRRVPSALDRIRFEHGSVPDIQLPTGFYDLLVTNFFLDCFDARGLDRMLPYLDRCLGDEAHWLYSDFCMPAAGWRRLRAQAWLTTMYGFFGMTTDLEARALVDPLPRLRDLRWDCQTSVRMDRDFLVAALLQRRGRATGLSNAIRCSGS